MRAERRAILWALAVAALIAWGWADVRRRAALEPDVEERWRATLLKVEAPSVARHRTDATVYLAAAIALQRGKDPYEAQSPRGWRYVYPPLYAVLLRPLSKVRAADAAFVLHLVNVLALVASAMLLARTIGPRGGVAVGVALLLASPFVVQTCQRGQVTLLLLALQVAALALLLRGRDVFAGILLALAVALRLSPALATGMVGLACLRTLAMGDGSLGARLRASMRFPLGVAAGLALGFAAVPAAVLGSERALETTKAWVAATRDIYDVDPSGDGELTAAYEIDELSFKNQGVRRVAVGWLGAPAMRHDPETRARTYEGPSSLAVAGKIATVVAWGVILAAAALAILRMRTRDERFRRTFALGVLLPVFVTRYAWPVHYVAAIPLLAEAVAALRLRALGAFALGAALFYAGHGDALRWLPEHGVLAIGTALACVAFVAADRRPSDDVRSVLDRYVEPDPWKRAFLRARLERGGLFGLAGLLPLEGTVVDLGAGDGLLALALAARTEGGGAPACRVVAVDHDPARVARLRAAASGQPVEAVLASMESFAIPPCDAVALVDGAHYLDGGAQEALLARVRGALRPGGTLLLRDPDAGAGLSFAWTRLHERLATALGVTRARIGRYRSAAEWEAALRSAGFVDVRVLPRSRLSLYADRTLVARAPA